MNHIVRICTRALKEILSVDRCDGEIDCPGGEDEKGCDYPGSFGAAGKAARWAAFHNRGINLFLLLQARHVYSASQPLLSSAPHH
ncbi:hypothetical protein ANCDUO_16815 [Ancylostoma duodenale]|uniref:Low-density lipoprotein receptor domain class A n=1 Tax=Ancylostoma duodenale TaxID=51022 RepID=A0A0C2C9T7_9BILA|nr:hypothetical protein ANCDUO_16815 [Ancylostoma duodenale]